jgi:hypothetical protein
VKLVLRRPAAEVADSDPPPPHALDGVIDVELSADTGLTMFAYTAEPGSKSAHALDLLASWAATPDQAETTSTTDTA